MRLVLEARPSEVQAAGSGRSRRYHAGETVEIGEPKRTITIEPLEEPAPSKAPQPEPAPQDPVPAPAPAPVTPGR